MARRFPVRGKVAIVTGAARGIGFATATELSRRGASVVVLDLDPEAAAAAAAALPGPALGLAADVTDRGAMQRVVAETVERYGGVDVVVANAGIASRGATFRAMSGETFDRVLDVNLNGVHRTVAAALPEIIARRGHVVVVSSVYAFVNGAGATPYAMSKAGVEQLGRALRIELAQHGAGASVAYFGFILLVAFGKDTAGTLIADDSVSIGIILGAVVIVIAPVLTSIYVRWANKHHDPAIAAARINKP